MDPSKEMGRGQVQGEARQKPLKAPESLAIRVTEAVEAQLRHN